MRYGIQDKIPRWFTSYLKGSTQHVVIDSVFPDLVELQCGVPHGSVAGPVLFILFSAPLQDIVASHGIKSVVYADDTQLLITFKPEDRDSAVRKMDLCIEDIRSWCNQNVLGLNDSETELMLFSSKFSNSSWTPQLSIGDSVIKPSSNARNLGAVTDPSVDMSLHINSVCKSTLAGIRKIGKIRHYLNQESTLRLVHAFAISKLDTCNFLTFGLPDRQTSNITKIQHVQRTAARVPRHQHITPMLQQLHWLPLKHMTAYKIPLIAFKALRGLAPVYIADLICVHVPPRSLFLAHVR